MGAAFYPEDDGNMQNLIHLADQAMYAVKRQNEHNSELNLLFAKDINQPENAKKI